MCHLDSHSISHFVGYSPVGMHKSHPRCLWQGYHSLHAYTPATERWADWEHLDRRSAEWRGSEDVKRWAGRGDLVRSKVGGSATRSWGKHGQHGDLNENGILNLPTFGFDGYSFRRCGDAISRILPSQGNRNSFLLLLNGL